MAPPKTIHVDTDGILLAINERITTLEAAVDSQIAYHHREIENLRGERDCKWTVYNLRLFSGGRAKTDSEQKTWQAEIRRLANDGLIETDCDDDGRIRYVRLSPIGKAHVDELVKQSI